MNYTATRHLVPSPGSPAGDQGMLLPWEMDADTASARQETWLLSFIDILALLLTLFVLLLAYQDRAPSPVKLDPAIAHIDLSWGTLNAATITEIAPSTATSTDGFAMPGISLVPLAPAGPAVGRAAADPSVSEPAPVSAAPPAVADETAVAADTLAAARVSGSIPRPDKAAAGGTKALTDDEAPSLTAAADTDFDQPLPSPQPLEQAPAPLSAADRLLETLRQSVLGERVEITARPGAVSLEINDNILFTPASAALSDQGLALLDQLAAVLRTLPYTLSVEGHTDNVPIHTLHYPSNWELSAARAAMVTRKLIEQGVAAGRVRAIGYGDTRPRSDNQTPENRAKNRRVTFVLQVQ